VWPWPPVGAAYTTLTAQTPGIAASPAGTAEARGGAAPFGSCSGQMMVCIVVCAATSDFGEARLATKVEITPVATLVTKSASISPLTARKANFDVRPYKVAMGVGYVTHRILLSHGKCVVQWYAALHSDSDGRRFFGAARNRETRSEK